MAKTTIKSDIKPHLEEDLLEGSLDKFDVRQIPGCSFFLSKMALKE